LVFIWLVLISIQNSFQHVLVEMLMEMGELMLLLQIRLEAAILELR
jgi:hypothetical protein